MKMMYLLILLLALPGIAQAKLIIEDGNKEIKDENGKVKGTVRVDPYGTAHFYDEDGNKTGVKRSDGFEYSDKIEEKKKKSESSDQSSTDE